MKIWKALRFGVLMLSSIAVLSFPVFAHHTVANNGHSAVYVNCDVLRCRSSAGITGNNIVARVYQGQKLEKVGCTNGWVEIIYNGMTCYVSEEYVTEQAPAKANTNTAVPKDITNSTPKTNSITLNTDKTEGTEIGLSSEWKYADFAQINTGKAMLYKTASKNPKGKTVCVNAGHGTSGGSSVKTLCHPDGTPKVTSGTTSAGATKAIAVSGGMTFSDGTPEHKVTLAMALVLKEKLLAQGYDVLMIRETEDVQLDNVARTVIANNMADCHIALHWDSTTSDKGAFYMSVPNVKSYREMEPVASNWEKHHLLGESLIKGLKAEGVKIFSGGSMAMDLTQTSYSTIPSVDIELGDKVSDHSNSALEKLADGLVVGLDDFFAQ